MNVVAHTSGDINTHGGGERPPCAGFAPDALPEVQKPVLAENSQTGVSTKNALSHTEFKAANKAKEDSNWYALRTTYGREKKAYDYLKGKNVETFLPTLTSVKLIAGKRKTITESRISNIFFAYGTENELKQHVYDNVNLPYLRFYYRHSYEGAKIIREPLIIPTGQIESLKIICASESEDIILVPVDVNKFKAGQKVRITQGCFKGVVGQVARFCGQQRVAVIIDGVLTIATAYIPSAFLEKI